MFDTRTRLFFFACLKDAARAGATLKSVAPAPGSDQQKNQLRLQRLRNTVSDYANITLHCVGVVYDHVDTVSALSTTTVRRHTFFENISAKIKNVVKPSLPVHLGPRWLFEQKKVSKNLRLSL